MTAVDSAGARRQLDASWRQTIAAMHASGRQAVLAITGGGSGAIAELLRVPGGSRLLLNVSFKVAGQDWIGYHAWQSRANTREWDTFVEGSTPRELELFGFPPPGHPIWDTAFVEATAARYPKLDLSPWRAALNS